MQNLTPTNEGLKALFVGQIEDDKIDDFVNLMSSLSAAYEEAYRRIQKEERPDGMTCINYNFYTKEECQVTDDNNLSQPKEWVKQWTEKGKNRDNCIAIIDHALKLSGYKNYLKKHAKDWENTHDICCSVTYYYDREGQVGFHQDSLGQELFVLLIYRDMVYGPELQLKQPIEFEQRMEAIHQLNFMPEYFINTVKALYRDVKDNNNNAGLVEWNVGSDKHSVELYKDLIEWIDVVPGPGGIVGFVDELLRHSTPLTEHRESNSFLLLTILNAMKNSSQEKGEREAIILLENKIEEIKEPKHYITIDELEDIIEDEEAKKIIKVLYERLGNLVVKLRLYYHFQALRERYKQTSKYQIVKGLFKESEVQLSEELGKLNLNLEELSNAVPYLEYSVHQLYGNYNSYRHTRSKKRRYSLRKNEDTIPTIPPSERRTFLRVWVTALPKKKD